MFLKQELLHKVEKEKNDTKNRKTRMNCIYR